MSKYESRQNERERASALQPTIWRPLTACLDCGFESFASKWNKMERNSLGLRNVSENIDSLCVLTFKCVYSVPAHTNPSCEAAVKAVRARAQQSAVQMYMYRMCMHRYVCVCMCMYISVYIIYKRAIEWERNRERKIARVKSESKGRECGVRLGKTATPIRVGGYTPVPNSGFEFRVWVWGFAQLLGVGVCRATRRQPTEFESSATATTTTTTITTTANRSDHNKVDRAALSLKAATRYGKSFAFAFIIAHLLCL